MLSDSEKEMFINLKKYMQSNIDNGYHNFYYNDLGWDFKCIDCINAIDSALKQSKEIEELKEINKKYIVQLTDEQYRELVDIIRDKTSKEWKDKIKAFIKEEFPDDEICSYCETFDINGIDLKRKLQSLLEKEE